MLNIGRRRTEACAIAMGGLLAASAAQSAEAPAWTHQIVYKADVMGPVAGAPKTAGRFLDNLDLIIDGDLERAIGWRGATIHAYALNNSGGKPNDLIGGLQGVDNIEVAHARTRLYELWVEQAFGDRASVRAGLYDLNSEFYSTEASHLLLSPPFGIGSEFSATGPNGPSIFPLTAPAVRLKVGGATGFYGQAAALSAHAGALSEPEHLKMGLDRGAILIGEAGWTGRTHLGLGAWTYTRRQDDLRDVTAGGDPVRRRARGAYLLAEREFWRAGEDRAASAFLRAGVSDGATTPFRGGWQAGLKVDGVTPGRPRSAASVGVQQGLLSGPQRAIARAAGQEPGVAESGLEATYADSVGRLTVQPDLQVVRHPGGDRKARAAVVLGVRLTLDLS